MPVYFTFCPDFRRRFLSLLSYQFRSFHPSLALSILKNKSVKEEKKGKDDHQYTILDSILLPRQLKCGRDKEHSLLEVFQIFLRRLEKQLELNFSLRARSLWARDSTRIHLKESGNTLALWGLLGWGTAPWIQLKESGIPLALWGGGVGDSTRYSTKGIRNRASSPGCPGGGGQHPGFC